MPPTGALRHEAMPTLYLPLTLTPMNYVNTLLPVINQCESPIARLICIPYSGGDVYAYSPWADLMPPGIELRAVQLPGRGVRLNEPLPTSLKTVAASIADAVCQLDALPFVLFGHSLGGTLCYETVCRLEAAGSVSHLKHIFLSGCKSPAHHASKQIAEQDLSDDRIRERLRRYRGTPTELLEDNDLFELFLPVLRSDFQMMERYRPSEAPVVRAPVTVFSGKKDQITSEQIDAWADYAGTYFSKYQFKGGHFFIHSDRTEVIRRIFQEVEITTGFRRWRTPSLAR